LQAFTGVRCYRLEYRGLLSHKSAELDVETAYRAPGEKKFRVISASGSQFMIDRVLWKLIESERDAADSGNRQRSALTSENYEFQLIGNDVIGGRNQYVLSVTPRSENKYLYRGKVWVDANDFAVVRIAAQPAKNPSFWTVQTDIEHVYVKVGEFWLPAHNTSISKIRLGGIATLTIDYSNYRIGAEGITSQSWEKDWRATDGSQMQTVPIDAAVRQ
jgi:hypothetical protein